MGDSAAWQLRRRRRFGCQVTIILVAALILVVLSTQWLVNLVVLVLVGVVLVIIARTTLRAGRGAVDVDDLVLAAARVQEGDYSVRVPESGSAEQRLLARAFNQMCEQLGASDVRRRSFMSDVSHELRTPLTVIQGQLEAIRDGIYPADAAHITPALDQVRTLEWLVEDLRTLALSDSGTLRLVRVPIDLAALVTEVVDGFRVAADAAGVRLDVSAVAGLPGVSVDPARIASVIRNLVANALRHTPGWRLDHGIRGHGYRAGRRPSRRGRGRLGPGYRAGHRSGAAAHHLRALHAVGRFDRIGTRPGHRAGPRGGARRDHRGEQHSR